MKSPHKYILALAILFFPFCVAFEGCRQPAYGAIKTQTISPSTVAAELHNNSVPITSPVGGRITFPASAMTGGKLQGGVENRRHVVGPSDGNAGMAQGTPGGGNPCKTSSASSVQGSYSRISDRPLQPPFFTLPIGDFTLRIINKILSHPDGPAFLVFATLLISVGAAATMAWAMTRNLEKAR